MLLKIIGLELFRIDFKGIYKCRALWLDKITAYNLGFFIICCMKNVDCMTKTATYYILLGHHFITDKADKQSKFYVM